MCPVRSVTYVSGRSDIRELYPHGRAVGSRPPFDVKSSPLCAVFSRFSARPLRNAGLLWLAPGKETIS
jgi:hypothetical protein